MQAESKRLLIENYRDLLLKHGDGPQAVQSSAEGSRFRADKLMEVGDLTGRRVLDLGCGIGYLYERLAGRFKGIDYTGIDIVAESIAFAARKYPGVRFLCRDILAEKPEGKFDYVLVNGVFNNAIPDSSSFLKELVEAAFDLCETAVGFNFISTLVNFRSPEMAYHDPLEVLAFCLQKLSRKVIMHHHYARCDVSVFVYR